MCLGTKMTDGLGQCFPTYVPQIICLRITWMRILKIQTTMLHWQIYWISGICILVSSQVILRHSKVWEPHWFVLPGMLQVQLTLFENPGITGKIELLLQQGRQYETNSKEIAMPFLDQNVFLFSVRKDSHIVKALGFVTEAVPHCFHWSPQSEVAVCKQKAEVWTALNNNKYNGVKRISRLEKLYFWAVKIKLKKESRYSYWDI